MLLVVQEHGIKRITTRSVEKMDTTVPMIVPAVMVGSAGVRLMGMRDLFLKLARPFNASLVIPRSISSARDYSQSLSLILETRS